MTQWSSQIVQLFCQHTVASRAESIILNTTASVPLVIQRETRAGGKASPPPRCAHACNVSSRACQTAPSLQSASSD